MDKNTVEKQINEFITKSHNAKTTFMKKQIAIMAKYCTPEVVAEIDRMHKIDSDEEVATISEVKHDKEAEVFTVITSDGYTYEVGASEAGHGTIEDILLPCDCTDVEDGKGKCALCGGTGDFDEEADCPMCEGEGTCQSCLGDGVISVRDAEAAHEHGLGPEEEPLSGAKELLDSLEEWEEPNKKLAKFVADYIADLDKIYYANYKEFQKLYRDHFNQEAFDYPHLIFPNYMTPYMDEFSKEEDGKYYGTMEIGGEPLLLTIEEKDSSFVIVALEAECSMAPGSPELHDDTYLECNCTDTTADGKPDGECDTCHGTGAIVCPVCLGVGWIPIAPQSLTADDIDNPERYRKGVEQLYDL